MRKLLTIVSLALAMTATAALPASAYWDAPRSCNTGWTYSIYRLSFCTSPYFVQDVVKNSADLRLYVNDQPASSTSWLAVDDWGVCSQQSGCHDRQAQIKSGEAAWTFYSHGIYVAKGGWAYTDINDTSFGRNGATIHGPGGSAETIVSGVYNRP
jgi:hypothetical protein